MQAIRSSRYVVFVCLVGMVLAVPAQATIYTWTDAQGVRHYSDTSRPPGARQAQLGHTPATGNSSSAASTAAPSDGASDGDARALNVITPQQGQLFANAPGQVPVSVIVGNSGDQVGLGDGESLRYELDGAPVGQGPSQDTRLTLSNVNAGAHTLGVTLLYRGHAVQHSAPVSFRVERRSASPPQSAADGRPPS